MRNHPAALTRIPLDTLSAQVRQALGEVDELLVYSLDMNVRFRRVTSRDGLLLHGPSGWAEAAPFWDYGPAESSTWLAAAIDAATAERPEPLRRSVPVNATIPVVPPEAAYERILSSRGCATAKVKVADPGTSLDEDLARVRAVARALADTVGTAAARLRIDANGAWDAGTAITAINALDEAAGLIGGLEYAEQPCPSVPELAAVRAAVRAPIAADESIRRAADPLEVARAGAADIAVIKIAPLGGIHTALRIGEETGLRIVVSSALESSIGLAVGVRAAARLPGEPLACGLATGSLLAADTVSHPLIVEDGALPVTDPEPDPGLLDGPGVDAELRERWLGRLEAMCSHVNAARPGPARRPPAPAAQPASPEETR